MNSSKMNARAKLLGLACLLLIGGCSLSDGDDASGNSAPTISGTPTSAVKIGDTWSFAPSASDPNGDSLTFVVKNSPAWANFNTSSGALSGSPTLGDIGEYTGIQISVSDGSLDSSLPDFSLQVTQIGVGSATLSWTPPTEYEDGTMLTDLAGYRFYYGTSPASYPNQVSVDNPGISSYVIENLSPNTYYIVATAVTDSGVESRFTNVATKQIH